MPSTSRAAARAHARRIAGLLAILILASLASGLAGSVSAATPVTVGWRDDLQYGDPAAPGGDDVTANRSQSKLWTNDGFWFGVRFDPRSTPAAKFRIWRFDMATQNWTNTNVAVDDRNRSHGDVLSDANVVYVASARAEGPAGTVGRDLRIYRYTYNTASNTYALVRRLPEAHRRDGCRNRVLDDRQGRQRRPVGRVHPGKPGPDHELDRQRRHLGGAVRPAEHGQQHHRQRHRGDRES